MTNDPPAPGIYYGVPAETYHSWNALSHSWLSRLRQSPAHLKDLMENGSDESSPAQDFGTAVHCAVLEYSTFDDRYAIRPEGVSGATKEGRTFKAAAEAEGKIILSAQDGRWCRAITRRALLHRRLSEWFCHDFQTEVSLSWLRDGYACRARCDLVIPALHIIADLKTTVTASPDGFARQIARYHYHTQGAWYADGMKRLTGDDWTFWIPAVEKKRPFLVSLYELAPGSTAQGMAISECDTLFDRYKQCCSSREWPGYGDTFQIELPEWALQEAATEVDEPFE